jgi:hypothetical protein
VGLGGSTRDELFVGRHVASVGVTSETLLARLPIGLVAVKGALGYQARLPWGTPEEPGRPGPPGVLHVLQLGLSPMTVVALTSPSLPLGARRGSLSLFDFLFELSLPAAGHGARTMLGVRFGGDVPLW